MSEKLIKEMDLACRIHSLFTYDHKAGELVNDETGETFTQYKNRKMKENGSSVKTSSKHSDQ